MDRFRDQIRREIGDRQVILKPNNVLVDKPLSATDAKCLEGTFEFLKSIGKIDQAVIAESAGAGPTEEGFSNYGYYPLAKKYGVKLSTSIRNRPRWCTSSTRPTSRPIRCGCRRCLLDRERNYIISSAKLKTHDQVIATLSLKNIVFGAPIKDPGFRFGKGRDPSKVSQKPIAHGGGIYGINYNLFTLSQKLRPHLAINDGYEGMEGNGPGWGDPVDQRVCVVSPDWLAADRVGVELMGIDFAQIGYLNYCARAGMGEADLAKIEILGEPVERHVRKYRLHDKVETQLTWMNPPKVSYLILDLVDPLAVEVVDQGVGVSHDDGRVGGDDKLGLALDEIMHAGKERQLPLRRECRFRLVEQVEAVAAKPVGEEVEHGFAVRLLMVGDVAVGTPCRNQPELLDLGGDIVEALGAEEEPVATAFPPHTAAEPNPLVEVGVRCARREVEVSGPAFGIESVGHRDGFEQSRLAGTVLAHEERRFRMQLEPLRFPDRRYLGRVGRLERSATVEDVDVVDEWFTRAV
jgi:uncharacterized protein (DUF362 family)